MIATIILMAFAFYLGFAEGKRKLSKSEDLLNSKNLQSLYEETKKHHSFVDKNTHPVLFELINANLDNQLKNQ